MTLRIGDPFPRIPLTTVDGRLDLADRWRDGPVVVAFHRLWCPFCQQATIEMAGRADELGAVVLVYPQDAADVAATCAGRGLPFTCASDPGRALEHAAGVPRMRPARYLRGATPARAVAALRSGARPHRPTSDPFQGRGTFVLAPGGAVAYVHLATGVADLAPVEDLVAAVRTAGRARA